jgi:hypothetical protein
MDRQDRPKETKTEDELAMLIHADLSQMEGCPQEGVSVTVYGTRGKRCLPSVSPPARCATKQSFRDCSRQ